jgi:hypothetical protein
MAGQFYGQHPLLQGYPRPGFLSTYATNRTFKGQRRNSARWNIPTIMIFLVLRFGGSQSLKAWRVGYFRNGQKKSRGFWIMGS